jgi:hypothetical protein
MINALCKIAAVLFVFACVLGAQAKWKLEHAASHPKSKRGVATSTIQKDSGVVNNSVLAGPNPTGQVVWWYAEEGNQGKQWCDDFCFGVSG